MYLRFYDAPNGKLLREALVEFEPLRLTGMAMALPDAIASILANKPHLGENQFENEEAERLWLNNAIALAELMIELVDIFVNPNVETFVDSGQRANIKIKASAVLRDLQSTKERHIRKIHKQMGENFGSATGFQTHNYNRDADRIIGLIEGE